jgi:hypothetical protein
MNALSSEVYMVTFNPNTFLVTFATSVAFSIDFSIANCLASALGYNATLHSSSGNQIVSDKIIGLGASPLAYHINIAYGSNNIDLCNSSSCSFVVPIVSTSQSLNYYECPPSFQQSIEFPNETKILNVSVTDINNSPIQLMNDWYMCLEDAGDKDGISITDC